MLRAIILALAQGIAFDCVRGSGLADAASRILAVVANPAELVDIFGQPLLELDGAELGEMLGVLAPLAKEGRRGRHLHVLHHASSALGREHLLLRLLRLPVHEHLSDEVVLRELPFAVAVAEEELAVLDDAGALPFALLALELLCREGLPQAPHLWSEVLARLDFAT
jgi:hypothetical protein